MGKKLRVFLAMLLIFAIALTACASPPEPEAEAPVDESPVGPGRIKKSYRPHPPRSRLRSSSTDSHRWSGRAARTDSPRSKPQVTPQVLIPAARPATEAGCATPVDPHSH